jgi:hypothetical protein
VGALIILAAVTAPPTVPLPGWVIPGASVIVAIIGAIALIVVRRTRGPVAIQDLWTENRQLRTDMTSLEAKVDKLIASKETQLTVNRIMSEGFDALSGYVERTTEQGHQPSYTSSEALAIHRARTLRSDDELWSTINSTSKEKNE